ncbi:hypothetical protein D3C80_1452600 [compost metagenome]
MPTRKYGGGHLACGLKVVEPDGDIQTRGLAVHQLDNRNTGDFNHFERARSVSTFR